MSTISVTPEVQRPTHFANCDIMAIGRRVVMLADADPNATSNVADLCVPFDPYRGECHCFAMQLTRVEADLTVARKAQRAGRDKTAVIAELTARRDALRSVTA